MRAFVEPLLPARAARRAAEGRRLRRTAEPRTRRQVHARPPVFCTGCPERPIFTAMKLVERELGPHHVACDIGCHLFSILPPFNIGNTTMGYGLGWSGASALNDHRRRTRRQGAISVMGDGGFWHNGLTSGVGNAVFNKATTCADRRQRLLGRDRRAGHPVLARRDNASRAAPTTRSRRRCAAWASNGCGRIDRTYDVGKMRDLLREALTTKETRAEGDRRRSECQLNRQRRGKPLVRDAVKRGERVVRERFGVDPDTCTGDHRCIRLSGCPSLSVAPIRRPAARGPGRGRGQQLRRLRRVRRGGGRGRAVPVLLPRRAWSTTRPRGTGCASASAPR